MTIAIETKQTDYLTPFIEKHFGSSEYQGRLKEELPIIQNYMQKAVKYHNESVNSVDPDVKDFAHRFYSLIYYLDLQMDNICIVGQELQDVLMSYEKDHRNNK